ncbi:SDR family oxidoreductase [Cupriavidus oxalaticus]|uniref:SDR family oxidoreductase n=1 Tax=Cupriavidus oxalaticus TaxID=96344 RepID=UPI004034F36B
MLVATEPAGRRSGTVLSILSTSTRTGRAFTVPSAMAKSALLAMTRSLAVEWGPKGIRNVAIAPSPFPTEGSLRSLNPGTRAGPERSAMNPMGRVGEQLELANLAAYLLSDQAAYINGESIAIDGGLHLRTSGAEDLLHWTDAQWDGIRSL